MTEVAPFFKKKTPRSGSRSVRKRSASPTENSATSWNQNEGSSVVHKQKRSELNPLRQGTNFSKRAKTNEIADADDVEDSWKADRYGDTSVGSYVRGSGSGTSTNFNREDATRDIDWQLQMEDEERAGRKPGSGRTTSSRLTEDDSQEAKKASNDDGLYHGAAAYNTYKTARDDGGSAKFKAKGPIRAPTNVRTVTTVDYQPDICKDYKETGYCGFGDTCKFLHDRSDYLAGWQLDALPNTAARQLEESDDEEEDDIPFACLICRQPFTDPIITRCGHYFCSSCAIKRFAKSPKCFACGAQTHGLFNAATKVIQRMERRKAFKDEERRERRRQRGEEVSDKDEEEDENQLLEGVEVEAEDDDE